MIVIFIKKNNRFYHSMETKALADKTEIPQGIIEGAALRGIETNDYIIGTSEWIKSKRGRKAE